MDWTTIALIYAGIAAVILFAGAWDHSLEGREIDRDTMLVILPAALSWPASLVVLAGVLCGEGHKALRDRRRDDA